VITCPSSRGAQTAKDLPTAEKRTRDRFAIPRSRHLEHDGFLFVRSWSYCEVLRPAAAGLGMTEYVTAQDETKTTQN
jgi:hypothetical protein